MCDQEKTTGTSSNEEAQELENQMAILRNGLNLFQARLAELPEQKREATLCLLYADIAQKLLISHLDIEDIIAREKIYRARTREQKLEVWEEFQATCANLKKVYIGE